MALQLTDYQEKTKNAVRQFWKNRKLAQKKQVRSGRQDQGERAGVTAVKNMDGFVFLMIDIICSNGLGRENIMLKRKVLTLPGFFRPTKIWDLVVINQGLLVAVLEFKSQVGPSFGNNANNRAEEAIGSATDFWTGFREGAFGESPRPFLGYFFLLEDAPGSRSPTSESSANFPIFPEFRNASYAERYKILCRKLVQEQLYTSACLIMSSRKAIKTGDFSEISELTNLRNFVSSLAGHIASAAARK
jgi:hypothetical protein